ncbi:MAG: hypothetical protein ACI90V_006353 [Bacillariaceae sp.]|jgi:hypothetical protein
MSFDAQQSACFFFYCKNEDYNRTQHHQYTLQQMGLSLAGYSSPFQLLSLGYLCQRCCLDPDWIYLIRSWTYSSHLKLKLVT